MCDFGISGYLVDSVAKTMDAGCKPYMAVSKNYASLVLLYFVSKVTVFLIPWLYGRILLSAVDF